MSSRTIPDAWVALPNETELRAILPAGHPYDFGFLPAMARLIFAHPGLAPYFGALFERIMFAPEGALARREREMIAAVAAAAQDCHY
jgi:hypothetical protein